MSSADAASRAAVPVSSARAEASRRNGAKSRGPKTPEGKARSAQNALKHGLRAQKYVVLPEEDAGEFAALEAALFEELAPASALQTVLARRVAIAAWRLMRADRMEVEVLDFRRGTPDNIGLAVIRDGNGTRSLETLLRYRGAATAELMRALRTLKALQAEQAAATALMEPLANPAARPRLARPQPNQPERLLEYALPEPPTPARTLHEATAPWTPPRAATRATPNQPETRQHAASTPAKPDLAPNQPEPHPARRPDQGKTTPPPLAPGIGAPDSHGRMDPLNKCRAWLRLR